MPWTDSLSVNLAQLLALACAWLLAAAAINPKTIGAGFYRFQAGLVVLLIVPAIPATYLAIEHSYPVVSSEWVRERISLILAMCAFAGLFNTWRSRMHAARFAVDPLWSRTLRTSLVMAGFWVGMTLVFVVQREFLNLPEIRFYWTQGSLFLGGLLSAGLVILALMVGLCREDPNIGPEALKRVLWLAGVALGLKIISSAAGLGLVIFLAPESHAEIAPNALELAGRWLAGLLVPAVVIWWLWRMLAANRRPGAADVVWLAAGCAVLGEWAGNGLLLKWQVPV